MLPNETVRNIMQDVGGKPLRYLSVIRDINGLVHTENALRKSERCNQTFAAHVAHEQRTPLAVLRTKLGKKVKTEREASACRTCRRYVPTACGDGLEGTISDRHGGERFGQRARGPTVAGSAKRA